MKILQVHNRYRHLGGEDVVVATEAEMLKGAGHEVIGVHTENPPGAAAATRKLLAGPWNPAAARRVAELARAHRPDVAHVHNTWFALSPAILPALRQSGVPVVMTLHNYRVTCANGLLFRDGGPCRDCVGNSPWPGVRHACYRGSRMTSAVAAGTIALHQHRGTWHRDVDLLLTPSGFARDQLIAAGIPADRIRAKPNAVQDPGTRSHPPSASRAVLFVGRLSHEKGLEVLLRAWQDLGPTDLELVVIGEGPLRATLEEAYASSTVRFVGALPGEEVRNRLLSARALAFPSLWYETFGMVLVEAMAAGAAVVASNLGAPGEMVEDLGASARVQYDDSAAWTAALKRLQDDEHVDAVGRLGREAYERAFTPEVTLSALEDAYAAVR